METTSYNTPIPNELEKLMAVAIESTTNENIANVVYEMYKHQYKCKDPVNKIWFELLDGEWIEVDKGYTLSEKLSRDVANNFYACVKNYFDKKLSCDQDNLCQEYTKKIENICIIYKNLKTKPFKENIMTICAAKFYYNDCILTKN